MLDSLKHFIENLGKKEFYRYATLYIAICVLIITGFIISHVYAMQDIQLKTRQLNQARKQVQTIFTKYELVENQQKKIDALLKKDKNFYVQKFFQDLAQKFAIHRHSSNKPTKQKLENGYIEESLQVNIAQLDTKQLCELLQGIEQEQRVYIKFIDITKMDKARKINVTMSIATLIPKSE